MKNEEKAMSPGGMLVLLLVLINAAVLGNGLVYGNSHYKLLIVSLPILALILADFMLHHRKRG